MCFRDYRHSVTSKLACKTDDFLLCNLSSYLLRVRVLCSYRSSRFQPNNCVNRPSQSQAISPGLFHTVVAAFPRLEELSIHEIQDTYNYRHYIDSDNSTETYPAALQWDDDLVHCSLTRLVVNNMIYVEEELSPSSGLLQTRTPIPACNRSGYQHQY
jgi:hypothetical protein